MNEFPNKCFSLWFFCGVYQLHASLAAGFSGAGAEEYRRRVLVAASVFYKQVITEVA